MARTRVFRASFLILMMCTPSIVNGAPFIMPPPLNLSTLERTDKINMRVLSRQSIDAMLRVKKNVEEHQLFELTDNCKRSCVKKLVKDMEKTYQCELVRYLKMVHIVEANCKDGRNSSKTSAGLIQSKFSEFIKTHARNEEVELPPREEPLYSAKNKRKMEKIRRRFGNLPFVSSRMVERTDWDTWHLDRIDQREPYPGLDFRFGTKCFPKNGEGAKIVIIDTGCRSTHKELDGRVTLRKTSAFNLTDGSDDNGHGTHVAALAAGTVFGVCKKCEITCFKALGADGRGSASDVMEAVDTIIDESISSKVPTVVVMSLRVKHASPALDDSVNRLYEAGIAPVVAASNNNRDACMYTPARATGAITVGSTTLLDTLYLDSNYGSCVNVLAPGEGITSASVISDNESEVRTGTSMSSPLVAGSIGLLLAEDPTLRPDDLLRLIQMNSRRLSYEREGKTFYNNVLRIDQDDCSLYGLNSQSLAATTIEPVSTSNFVGTLTVPLIMTNPLFSGEANSIPAQSGSLGKTATEPAVSPDQKRKRNAKQLQTQKLRRQRRFAAKKRKKTVSKSTKSTTPSQVKARPPSSRKNKVLYKRGPKNRVKKVSKSTVTKRKTVKRTGKKNKWAAKEGQANIRPANDYKNRNVSTTKNKKVEKETKKMTESGFAKEQKAKRTAKPKKKAAIKNRKKNANTKGKSKPRSPVAKGRRAKGSKDNRGVQRRRGA